MAKSTSKDDRVGLYVKPQTRSRLHMFKYRLSDDTDRIIPLDKVINILLDHYDATTPEQVSQTVEVAR